MERINQSSSCYIKSPEALETRQKGRINVPGHQHQVSTSIQPEHRLFFEDTKKMLMDTGAQLSRTPQLERQAGKRFTDADQASSSSRSAGLNRSSAGRYEHLGDFVAKLNISTGTVASTSRSENTPVFSQSLEHLAEQFEEKAACSTTLNPGYARIPQEALKGLKDRFAKVKPQLQASLSPHNLQLTDVISKDTSKEIALNFNHIESKHYLGRTGMWLHPHDNPLVTHKLEKQGDRADEYFQASNIQTLPLLEKPSSHNSLKIMKTLLQNHPGFVIGEAHHCLSSKKELIQNMAALRQNGVSTLFMEHLCEESHGKDLAQYIASPKGSKMPRRLENYLDMQTEGNRRLGQSMLKYGFKEVVQAAKEAGLNVIPLDTIPTYAASKRDDNLRIKVMNYYAAEKIRLSNSPGKWIAFVGSAHTTSYKGALGLAELTGTRSMIIDDFGKSEKKANVAVNVENYISGMAPPDIVLSYKSPASGK